MSLCLLAVGLLLWSNWGIMKRPVKRYRRSEIYRSAWCGPIPGCPIEAVHLGRTCKSCKAARMREYRAANPLTEAERVKDRARSYAGVYLRRGLLVKASCVDCGSPDSQMHHEDYSKPLDVIWLCRPCHLLRHDVGVSTLSAWAKRFEV